MPAVKGHLNEAEFEALCTRVINALNQNDAAVLRRNENGNNTGDRIEAHVGGLVDVYRTGTVRVVRENRADTLTTILAGFVDPPLLAADRNIHIIADPSDSSLRDLKELIRAYDLTPVPFSPRNAAEVRSHPGTHRTRFAVVLMSPAEEARSLDGADCWTQAGQRVGFEFGALLHKLGPERIVVLVKAHPAMRDTTKLDDVTYITYEDILSTEVETGLRERLLACHYELPVIK